VLGTVAEHYTPQTAAEEIGIWRAAHGGSLDPLVQAIRDCSFLSRQAALLKVLASAVPEGDELLASLLRDPELGPVALLAELPRSQRENVVRAVRDSCCPARETLEEFRALVAEPILSAPSRPRCPERSPTASPPGKRRDHS
jgi:hypothetical protein